MKLVVVILLAVVLLILVRRNLLQVDLSFPLFLAVVVLGFLSMSDSFLIWASNSMGIVYPPMTVVLAAIALLLALITLLAIAFSRLRFKHLMLVRYLAETELSRQERELRTGRDDADL